MTRPARAAALIAVALAILASSRETPVRAAAQAPDPILQILGPDSIAVTKDKPEGSFVIVNQGVPQLISAQAAEPPSVTLTFDAEPSPIPSCPEKTPPTSTSTQTKRALSTGTTTRLRVRGCGELSGLTQSITLWGAAGGAVTMVKVQLGVSPAKATIAALESIEIDSPANHSTAEGSYCLSGTATGVVGFVRRDTTVRTASLADAAPAKGIVACPESTTYRRLTVAHDGGAGTYTGKIDTNGAAEGGLVAVTINVRKHWLPFGAAVALGIILATAIGWLTRFGRDWGFVDQAAADVRADVWSGQQDIRQKVRNVYHETPNRWLVVSSSPPRNPTRAIDKALAMYLSGSEWIRRLVETPGSDRLAGGVKLAELRKTADTYLQAVDLASTLVEWRDKAETTASPTVAAVDRALKGDTPPASVAIETLKSEVDASSKLLGRFRTLQETAETIEIEALAANKPKVAQAARAFVQTLWQSSLSEAGVKDLEAALEKLWKQLPAEAAERANRELDVGHLSDARNVQELFSGRTLREHILRPLPENPRERAASIRTRNFRMELGIAGLGLIVALLSAYASLYASNRAWGTGKDILAAVTWAITTGAAVQVARHFTTRLPA